MTSRRQNSGEQEYTGTRRRPRNTRRRRQLALKMKITVLCVLIIAAIVIYAGYNVMKNGFPGTSEAASGAAENTVSVDVSGKESAAEASGTEGMAKEESGAEGKEGSSESAGNTQTGKLFHDGDGDGIPDQEDIFQSAKEYVATKPMYADRYYAEGYPDDGYGVCTDVIGFAFLGAGYDLRKLVSEDIKNNRDAYPEITDPDTKIDFRRVQNLTIYFTRHCDSLTTDFNDTEAWLPGDIVTWPHHIGIISDKKNERGVPYVIHHAGVKQTEYEEDILEGTSHYTYVREITGHFRVNY